MSSYATSGSKHRTYNMTALTCNKKFLKPIDKVYKQNYTTMSEFPFESSTYDTLPGTGNPDDVKAYTTDVKKYHNGSFYHPYGNQSNGNYYDPFDHSHKKKRSCNN
jgi:hypothetical protein